MLTLLVCVCEANYFRILQMSLTYEVVYWKSKIIHRHQSENVAEANITFNFITTSSETLALIRSKLTIDVYASVNGNYACMACAMCA